MVSYGLSSDKALSKKLDGAYQALFQKHKEMTSIWNRSHLFMFLKPIYQDLLSRIHQFPLIPF